MMVIRWLTAAISIAALSGCAYPSFNRDSFDMQVRTMTLDPRFPLLKAYKECMVDTDGGENSCKAASWSRYNFAHFDPASRDRTPIITSHYSDYRSFTGTPGLVPSYSFNPGMRMLDTFVELNGSTFCYEQHVVFYRNQAVAEDSEGHRLSFQLRDGGCAPRESSGPQRGAKDLLQDVKFVVVFGGRAMIFVSLKNATPETPGLTVREVLGDVSGIPAELTAQAYRVYRVDTTPDSLRSGSAILVKAPLCTVGRPAATGVDGGGACPNPSGTLAVQRDPMPHIALETGAQQFNCHVRTSSTDWHIFAGMAATALGKFDFSQRCTPAK